MPGLLPASSSNNLKEITDSFIMVKVNAKIDTLAFLKVNSDVISLRAIAARSGVSYNVLHYAVSETGKMKPQHLAAVEHAILKLFQS
jgi:hypothetical protein